MAGNIIPAIATTNAIIAGLIVLQALHILRGTYDGLSWPYLTAKSNKPITGTEPPLPKSECGSCQDTYTSVQCDPEKVTLGELVGKVLAHAILGDGDEEAPEISEVDVFEAGRLLADPDFDVNLDKSLAQLGCVGGKFISVVDEDDRYNTLTIALCLLPYVYMPKFYSLLTYLILSAMTTQTNLRSSCHLLDPVYGRRPRWRWP